LPLRVLASRADGSTWELNGLRIRAVAQEHQKIDHLLDLKVWPVNAFLPHLVKHRSAVIPHALHPQDGIGQN
jgi:hypothetical protein